MRNRNDCLDTDDILDATLRRELSATISIMGKPGNTGLRRIISAAVDRHGEEHHELSGRAKDMGSAAVFISLLVVVLVWGAIAWQQFGAQF